MSRAPRHPCPFRPARPRPRCSSRRPTAPAVGGPLRRAPGVASTGRPAAPALPAAGGSLSHFGGVPTVPLGFTWPFVVLPDGRDRALTFVLQVDCAAIPEDGRLGLMPDHGQLYVFLDLDWGNHWVWSVRYENGDPDTFVPARVPAGLPKRVPVPRDLGLAATRRRLAEPAAVVEPPARARCPVTTPREARTTTGSSGRVRSTSVGPSPTSTARWSPRATTRTSTTTAPWSGPYATFPHDWQAVRIATGLLQARHLRPAGGVRARRGGAAAFADASGAGRTAQPRRSPGTGSPRTTATPSGSSSSTSSP